jgi:glycosyltransferase involved in cell wall biosynthesis
LNISAVICAKNSESTIKECLESVIKNEAGEVIVIDGNSADGTVTIARGFTNKIFSDEGKGLAYARQLGAKKASNTYIAYIDSDTVLPSDCLKTMVRELEGRGYVAIHAQIVAPKSASYWEWAEDQHFHISFNKEGERHSIGTIAAIFQRNKVIEYKFDSFFSGASEDGDLCYRLRKGGYILGVSSAFAYHFHRANAKSFAKQRRWYGKGNARFFWKHKSIAALLGPPAMIPFGIIVCLKKRSLRMMPYYSLWAVASTYGLLSELTQLSFRRFMPDVPK